MTGGFFSLLASAFFTLFVGVQLWAWMFAPKYNQALEKNFVSRGEEESYTVLTSLFLPIVGVVMTPNVDDESQYDFNNLEYFDIGFV